MAGFMLEFHAKGHPDIVGHDAKELRFSLDEFIDGSVIGIEADLDLDKLREFMQHHFEFRMHIIVGDESISLNAHYNSSFSELSLTKAMQGAGFGIVSSHSSADIPQSMLLLLQDPKQQVKVQIEKTTE